MKTSTTKSGKGFGKKAAAVVETKKAPKAVKAAKANDKAKKPVLSDNARIVFVAERPKGRSKKSGATQTLALVPRKGHITFKALAAKAEEAGVSVETLPRWINTLANWERVRIAA